MSSFDVLNFLKHYQQYPCLWDKTNANYKDRKKREDAETALLESMQLENLKALRAKIRSIRGTYNNEVRKVRKSMTTGSGSDDIYRPKLHWYQYARTFLCKNEEDEPEFQTILMLNKMDQSRIEEEEIAEEANDPQRKPEEELTSPRRSSSTPARPLTKKHLITGREKLGAGKERVIDGTLKEALQTLIKVQNNVLLNEFNLFGQQVGVQLNKLSLKKALEVQQEIQTILTRARISELSRIPLSSTPSDISTSSTQC